MEDSILDTVKLVIGLDTEYTPFDTQLIIATNMAFTNLQQYGVGPEEGFRITGPDETWSSYLQDELTLEMVKEFVPLKVKMVFDPPASGIVADAYKSAIAELEWRIIHAAEMLKED